MVTPPRSTTRPSKIVTCPVGERPMGMSHLMWTFPSFNQTSPENLDSSCHFSVVTRGKNTDVPPVAVAHQISVFLLGVSTRFPLVQSDAP